MAFSVFYLVREYYVVVPSTPLVQLPGPDPSD
jgi:hypothetical protein